MKKENKIEQILEVGLEIKHPYDLKIGQVVLIKVKHVNSSYELMIMYAVIDKIGKMIYMQPYSPNQINEMVIAGRIKKVSVNSQGLYQIVGDVYSVDYKLWSKLTLKKEIEINDVILINQLGPKIQSEAIDKFIQGIKNKTYVNY